MRQAEKEKKKIQSLIPFILAPGKRIPKKIVKKFKKYKTSSRQYFQPKRDDISRKGVNKISVPNFVQSQRGKENFEKNSKKIQKIKKSLPGIIFSRNGMRQAEKEKKKILVPNSVHTRPGQENFKKNSKKIKKPHPSIIFCQNGMRLDEKKKKKILVPNSVHTRPGQDNSQKE